LSTFVGIDSIFQLQQARRLDWFHFELSHVRPESRSVQCIAEYDGSKDSSARQQRAGT
jgi:hypothetical protein